MCPAFLPIVSALHACNKTAVLLNSHRTVITLGGTCACEGCTLYSRSFISCDVLQTYAQFDFCLGSKGVALLLCGYSVSQWLGFKLWIDVRLYSYSGLRCREIMFISAKKTIRIKLLWPPSISHAHDAVCASCTIHVVPPWLLSLSCLICC